MYANSQLLRIYEKFAKNIAKNSYSQYNIKSGKIKYRKKIKKITKTINKKHNKEKM